MGIMRDAWTRGLAGLKAGFLLLLIAATMASFAMDSDVQTRLDEARARQREAAEAQAARRDLAAKVDAGLQRNSELKARLEAAAREHHFLIALLASRRTK